MKKSIFLLLALFLAAADDPVVAERGQDRITLSQARALLAAADPQTRQRLGTDPQAMTTLLRNVLIQRAIAEAAQAEHWEQRPDVQSLLTRAHDEVVSQSFLAAKAAVPASYPSEVELQTAYDQNKQKFLQPRTYHLAQIFVPKGNASPADTQRHLASLRGQISRGRLSMEAAAKQIPGSQFQDGLLPDNQLPPAAKPAIAGLLEGAIADPFCIPDGCHLIKLITTRPAGPAPLPDVRDSLIRALRQQKQADEERAYASGLLAKQPVAINEIELSHLAQ
jgi:peptidylprolyl isomerase